MSSIKQRIQSTAISFLVVATFCLSACKGTPTKAVIAQPQPFTVPQPPAILTTPEQRVEYVATHYWDNFNFSDTTLVRNADITEQALANFISLISGGAPHSVVEKSIEAMMTKATADSTTYAHFIELYEKYLYDPNSPLRNEDLYIVVLQNIIANSTLDELHKTRPRYQLNMALRNRTGTAAADFTYTSTTGAKKRLHDTKGDRILLFFFEPDCPDCQRVKEYIAGNGIADKATIVMVNPDVVSSIDSLYDVRARPLLYLLDKDKKVLLKDAAIEQINNYLSNR